MSFDKYRQLLNRITSDYRHLRFDECGKATANGKPSVLMRHDIDVCLLRALNMGRLEAEHGVRSTYFVMATSPLYSPASEEGRGAIRELLALGHEIGIHFDVAHQRDIECLETRIAGLAAKLGDIVGEPVRSVSFHRPTPDLLRGPRLLGGLINSYAAELMNWYISDSNGSFRNGDPAEELANPRGPLLQFLTHPVWWGEQHHTAGERVSLLCAERGRGKGDGFEREFDEALMAGTGLWRDFDYQGLKERYGW